MIHVDRSERMFIIAAIVLLVVFFSAVVVSALAFDITLPAPVAQVNPNLVATPGNYPEYGFADPIDERLRDLGNGRYEVYIMAQTWAFLPNEVRIPKGSTLTFYVTSKDVQHGFNVESTNINMMILPGQVSELTATFDEPGEFNFICHEYCGIAHHTMFGRLIVEE